MTGEDIKEKDVFGHFDGMGELVGTKPVMLYFYWPEEDADSKDEDIANQVRRCKLMDELLAAEAVRSASVLFHSYKCNIKEVNADLKRRYKLKIVPKVVFFDVKGRKVWHLTSTKAKPDGVAGKMAELAAQSKKLLKKMNK